MAMQTKTLRETCCQSGATHDEAAPVIKGVKVLGLESLNRRRYTPQAVKEALGLYEGRAVNIDHPTRPNEPRPLSSRFGLLKVVKEDNGLRADLHYNPAHPMAETVKWWARNQPGALGLSHDAVGSGKDVDGVFVVEKILDVRSVDLVADPATTKGLFEGANMPDGLDMTGVTGSTGGDTTGKKEACLDDHVASAIGAVVKDSALDRKAKLKKIGVLLGVIDEKADVKVDGEGGEPTEEQIRRNPAYRVMAEKLDRLETEARVTGRRLVADRLIREASLPDVAVTDLFRTQLIEAKDEAAMKALIDDRRKIAGTQRPKSSPASAGDGGASGGGKPLTEEQALNVLEGRAAA